MLETDTHSSMTEMIIHEYTLMIYVIDDDGISGLGQRFYPFMHSLASNSTGDGLQKTFSET